MTGGAAEVCLAVDPGSGSILGDIDPVTTPTT